LGIKELLEVAGQSANQPRKSLPMIFLVVVVLGIGAWASGLLSRAGEHTADSLLDETKPASGHSSPPQVVIIVVGVSQDKCHNQQALRINTALGEVQIDVGDTGVLDLPTTTTRLIWNCGGSDESASNDKPFNAVRCQRSAEGAITWTFYMKQ